MIGHTNKQTEITTLYIKIISSGSMELQYRQHEPFRLHGQGGNLGAGGRPRRVPGRGYHLRVPGGAGPGPGPKVYIRTIFLRIFFVGRQHLINLVKQKISEVQGVPRNMTVGE